MDRQTRRFEDLLRASVDWTWETDGHGNITVLSHGFLQSLESPIGTHIGNPLIDLAEGKPKNPLALQIGVLHPQSEPDCNADYYTVDEDGHAVGFRM